MFLPFLSAILGIIAFLPVNFYPVSFVFLVPLFVFFIREDKFWRLIFGALIFKIVFYLGTIYFTLEPLAWGSGLLIFAGLPASVWLIKKLIKFFDSPFIIPYSLFIALPFLWTIFDILHARFSLLPSSNIIAGSALGSSPFLGLAAFGGFTALTFFTAVINILIVAIINDSPLTRGEKKRGFLLVIAIITFISSAYLISQNQLQKNSAFYSNLPNSLKFASVSVNEKFTAEQFDMLKKDLAAGHVNLIIFPEDILDTPATAEGGVPPEAVTEKNFFLAQNTAKELKTNLLSVFDTARGGARYNSAVLFDKEGRAIAQRDKNRLTFIGEYWPFGNWLPPFYGWLKKFDPGIAGYAIFKPQNAYREGERQPLTINLPQDQISFAAPVCLEIDYPGDLAEYRKSGAKFIANPSSNRWIKKGLKHYLYLTNNLKKIEAVWLKIPVISSGVNDYAGVVSSDGKTRFADYESAEKNYGIFWGEIKY